MMRLLLLATLPALLMVATATAQAAPERDREAILAMAGEFRVEFEFRETLTLSDHEASEPHNSRALEWVKVIADEGDFISLQHILVIPRSDESHVVKHWRQDWRYEAASAHAYVGAHTWVPETAPANLREGAWLQTVYQVDDSPRYAGWGRWTHLENASYWEADDTWRPLPRRERTKRSDYDVMVGQNRHTITADGWVHQQDNYKLDLREDGQNAIVAWERGFNTYTRVDDRDFSAAETYWEETAAFWAQVRQAWGERFATNAAIHVKPLHEGERMFTHVMDLAQDYREGYLDNPAEAIAAQFANFVTVPAERPMQARAH